MADKLAHPQSWRGVLGFPEGYKPTLAELNYRYEAMSGVRMLQQVDAITREPLTGVVMTGEQADALRAAHRRAKIELGF